MCGSFYVVVWFSIFCKNPTANKKKKKKQETKAAANGIFVEGKKKLKREREKKKVFPFLDNGFGLGKISQTCDVPKREKKRKIKRKGNLMWK